MKGEKRYKNDSRARFFKESHINRNRIEETRINFVVVYKRTRLGSSINDVTVLAGGGQGFWDDCTKPLAIKRVTKGVGVKTCPIFRDVIYERTLINITSGLHVGDNRDSEKRETAP